VFSYWLVASFIFSGNSCCAEKNRALATDSGKDGFIYAFKY